MGSGSARMLRNALGGAAILLILAVVTLGLPAWDRSLPSGRRLPAGQRYEVGAGVSLVPPRDAVLDVTQTRPTSARGSALFLIGGIRYAVVAEPFTGSLDQAARKLRTKITATHGYQVASGDTTVRTDAGVTGRQGAYASSGRDGWYAVYLHAGVSVEVTVSGTQPVLRERMPGIERSMATIRFAEQA